MKQIQIIILSILTFLPFSLYALTTEASKVKTKEEIETLVSPIALYPDILLSNILPAATFPDQIADAALLIHDKSDAELIAQQSWDDSVKIIATYPGILKMMYEKLDWTTNLGNVFLNQSELVMSSIQKRRSQAKQVGNLKTNDQQMVTTQYVDSGKQVIVIEPKDPQIIYVQESSPVVYTSHVEQTSYVAPLVTFGLGVALGAAVANNNDNNNYYYHSSPWGGNIWVHNNYHNDWYDAQRDRQEFHQDRYQKEQNFRHDRVSEQQDFRNDHVSDRQDFRQEQYNNGNKDFSANRQAQLSEAKSKMQSQGFSGSKLQSAKSSGSFSKSSASGSYASTQRTESFSSAKSQASKYHYTPTKSSLSDRKASYTSQISTRGSQSRSLSTSSSFSRASSGFSGGGGFRRR